MTDKEIKMLRFIHSKLYFWMYNPKSHFRVGMTFTPLELLFTTKSFRSFEKKDVHEAIMVLSKHYPDLYDISPDKKYIRIPLNHPIMVANSVLS